MKGLLAIFLLFFGTHSMVHGAEELSRAAKAKLAKEVKSIFRNKCAKCHGPVGIRETEKPKGEFDFILDLERVALKPEIILPGNPDESKLANMVDDDLMPDAEVGEEPLPENEKEIIRRWILAGAPSEKGEPPSARYHCPAAKKYDRDRAYTPEQLEHEKFSIRLEELPEGTFLSHCSFSELAGKVTCGRHKVDRIEFDEVLKIKKFYVFGPQLNFQIFSDFSFLEDDGRGSVQYGKCELFSP